MKYIFCLDFEETQWRILKDAEAWKCVKMISFELNFVFKFFK